MTEVPYLHCMYEKLCESSGLYCIYNVYKLVQWKYSSWPQWVNLLFCWFDRICIAFDMAKNNHDCIDDLTVKWESIVYTFSTLLVAKFRPIWMNIYLKVGLSQEYIIIYTVKFLIVAASPIEAAPQTFKKCQFFYKKFPTLKTSIWSRMVTFEICQEPKLFSYLIKRTMTRCLSRRVLATQTALIEHTLYKPR